MVGLIEWNGVGVGERKERRKPPTRGWGPALTAVLYRYREGDVHAEPARVHTGAVPLLWQENQ